tara:strand:- start:1377 stop:1922 length:546 start_codon:yes stop_codon:yes gene_type:complete
MIIKPLDLWYITSSYGMRVNPVSGVYKLHNGIDLRAPTGTPIFAANSGTVSDVTNNICGNGIKISGLTWTTGYCHLSDFTVSDGDTVQAGDIIGHSGSTGNSTAAHLHFTVRKDGVLMNPEHVTYFNTIPEPIYNSPTIYNSTIPEVNPTPNYKVMILVLSCFFVGGGLIWLWTRKNKKKK